jgi:hypothetical protein
MENTTGGGKKPATPVWQPPRSFFVERIPAQSQSQPQQPEHRPAGQFKY